MSEKVLIEKQVINSIIKAINIHLELLNSDKIVVVDKIYRDKIMESIRYLSEIPNMLISDKKEMLNLKRNAYLAYSNSKKELESLKKVSSDIYAITKKENEVKQRLELYIKLKTVCCNS